MQFFVLTFPNRPLRTCHIAYIYDYLFSMHVENPLGDIMEAFLGFGWFMGHPDNTQSPVCRRQLQVYDDLHAVVGHVYDNWDKRDLLIW